MSEFQLKKATRSQVKLRMGLSGVSGSGKTYSALLLAYGLTGDYSKIAVIDTENESASLYSDLGEFNTIPLTAPYTPERYIQCIEVCEKAGIEVIIIDSITHEWDGKGGCLEIVESLGGRYQDWGKVTPRHAAFVDKILQSKCHVITCVRRKQDYDMTKDSNGKIKVEKAGLKEITREGFEYELTLNINIESNHMATASKDRTGLFVDKPSFMITAETGKKILEWCKTGINETETLLTEYKELVTEAKHVINETETLAYLKDCETWPVTKLRSAIAKLTTIISDRETDLMTAELLKKEAAQNQTNV